MASPTAKTRRRRGATWASWIATGQAKDPKLADCVESNIEESLTFYRLPRPDHQHRKSTNRLKRPSEEILTTTAWCASSPTPSRAFPGSAAFQAASRRAGKDAGAPGREELTRMQAPGG